MKTTRKNEPRINFENRTITITKEYEKKARQYKSNEYNELMEIRKQNEGFKIIVGTCKRTASKNSKITLSDIKRYVQFHDDENKSLIKELEQMCHAKENGELHSSNFFEIKKWFFKKYPKVMY